ncbi:hypothetical protein [Vibrio splendidus]|uniref:hypothetical protein n=1 Tax=Vibrio splendidus TaxID=29497 RepID=UPI0034A0C7CA
MSMILSSFIGLDLIWKTHAPKIANHWLTGVSYQHDFLDLARDEFKWNNVFQFGSVFGLVANLEYAERDEAEVSYELGLQFSF